MNFWLIIDNDRFLSIFLPYAALPQERLRKNNRYNSTLQVRSAEERGRRGTTTPSSKSPRRPQPPRNRWSTIVQITNFGDFNTIAWSKPIFAKLSMQLTNITSTNFSPKDYRPSHRLPPTRPLLSVLSRAGTELGRNDYLN